LSLHANLSQTDLHKWCFKRSSERGPASGSIEGSVAAPLASATAPKPSDAGLAAAVGTVGAVARGARKAAIPAWMREALLKRQAERAAAEAKAAENSAAEASRKGLADKAEASLRAKSGSRYVHLMIDQSFASYMSSKASMLRTPPDELLFLSISFGNLSHLATN
jgi:hypothetical protein